MPCEIIESTPVAAATRSSQTSPRLRVILSDAFSDALSGRSGVPFLWFSFL